MGNLRDKYTDEEWDEMESQLKKKEKILCPQCGSEYLMTHIFDSAYKVCMKCQHSFKI